MPEPKPRRKKVTRKARQPQPPRDEARAEAPKPGNGGGDWTQLGDGELEKAIAEFDKALSMDRRHVGALLGKGIALKLKGDKTAAREYFEKAEDADPRSDAGREARRHLDNL